MKCPICKTTDLLMTGRRSIEIDYCPECRGVWLDRGELDKLIAQDSANVDTSPASRAGRDDRAAQGTSYERERYRGHDDHRGYKKKRSLFDMFDFD